MFPTARPALDAKWPNRNAFFSQGGRCFGSVLRCRVGDAGLEKAISGKELMLFSHVGFKSSRACSCCVIESEGLEVHPKGVHLCRLRNARTQETPKEESRRKQHWTGHVILSNMKSLWPGTFLCVSVGFQALYSSGYSSMKASKRLSTYPRCPAISLRLPLPHCEVSPKRLETSLWSSVC